MPDEALEPGAEAGGGDHRLRVDARAVYEQDLRAVEAGDRGDDLDEAAAHRADDADVEDRRRAVARNAVRIPCSGRGSPYAARSGIESFRCVFEIGSTQSGGRCLIAIPISCAGTPAVARRTICGGVRTERRVRTAPPSATSVAISAPEFPAPTTSTSRPRNGSGFRYSDGVDQLAGEALAPGPVRDERLPVVAGRHDHRA